MRDEVKKYLLDIIESIDAIDTYIGDKRVFKKFQADRFLRKAIERELEIIGEAINKSSSLDPNLKIKHKKNIVGMRNIIAHAYDSVDEVMIWSIVINHLPDLKREIKILLKK